MSSRRRTCSKPADRTRCRRRNSGESTAGDSDYFASSRLTREKARDEAVSTLKEISESADADAQAKADAAGQISVLAENSVQEANIESLIRAKGYEDAVVMLSDGAANIVVSPPEGGTSVLGCYGHPRHRSE